MKKFQTKTAQLTLGAVLLAVFMILHVIVPGGQKVIQGFLMILTFLPVTIYAMNCGMKKTLLMTAAGVALSAILLPLEVTLSFAIPALLIGLMAGWMYGKRMRLTVILVISLMQLLQNVVELYVYHVLTGVDVLESYRIMVDIAYQKIPSAWLENALFSMFMDDMMICMVPCLAILVSGAKGILCFTLIKLLNTRLVSVMGPEADSRYTQQTKFGGKGLSVAYFCAVCVCALVVALPVLSIIPYHFVCSVAAATGLLLVVLYFYYFYINRVRSEEDHQKRLIYSFLMMILLPINIFALPFVEMYLLKKETEDS